jgi:hypothetical protein
MTSLLLSKQSVVILFSALGFLSGGFSLAKFCGEMHEVKCVDTPVLTCSNSRKYDDGLARRFANIEIAPYSLCSPVTYSVRQGTSFSVTRAMKKEPKRMTEQIICCPFTAPSY